ncbi:unnamed protein product [Paramecium pentaurelia]|uniref:G domain-containing protein n=1 Tax=Paramecium pentaurelia TaxID=43138 RepID=A0A8S1Y6A4_9CILI|nr:unnamed protein product [Paramecium pentaurelia]
METNKPIAILLSKVGRGKTSFYNKICKQSQKTYFGGQSCTRELFLKCSFFGKGFYLMDTPGFGCDEDIIIHLSALFVAAERSLNAILVLTKFDRACVMKEEINQALSMLSPCRNMIIIIVTFWDDVEKEPIQTQEKFKKEIQDLVMKPLKLNSFICTSKNTPGDIICYQLDQLIQNNVKKSVQLTRQEFSFKFTQLSSFSITDEIETHKLKQDFQNKCKGALRFIEQQKNDDQEMTELMHELILAMKEEAHATVMEFTKQNRESFEKLVEKFGICDYTYLAHTKLKAEIMGYLEQVIQIAQKKMQTYKYHVYNYIKQCPYCGLIWFKVAGCENLTRCGEQPNKDDEKLAPQPKKYKIEFQESELKVIKLTNSGQIIKRLQINQTTNYKGCGKKLDWKNLPTLSEDLVKELKNTGFLDVLSMLKDKDSKDIVNEEKYWQQIDVLQNKHRELVNKQIEDENNIYQQSNQKFSNNQSMFYINQNQVPKHSELNKNSNHKELQSQSKDENCKTSFGDNNEKKQQQFDGKYFDQP